MKKMIHIMFSQIWQQIIPYFIEIKHPLFARILGEKFGVVLNFDIFFKSGFTLNGLLYFVKLFCNGIS